MIEHCGAALAQVVLLDEKPELRRVVAGEGRAVSAHAGRFGAGPSVSSAVHFRHGDAPGAGSRL